MLEGYSEYKDINTSWLHSIPKNWVSAKIGELFEERKVKVSDKKYAPLTVGKMGVVPQLSTVAKSNDSDNRKLVKSGDYVINSRSDRKGSSGLSSLDGSVSLINIVLTPREGNGKYYHYLLRSYYWIEEYYRNGRGIVADLWTTRFSEMKSIILPIPPRPEQDQIVRYLDWKVSMINKCINVKKKQIELLMEHKQVILNQAVTKGLDINVPMRDSDIEWFGKIPAHWNSVKIKHIFKERVEKGYPDKPLLAATQNMGVVPKNIYGNRTVEASKDFHLLKLVKTGDFVISLRSFQGGIEYAYYEGIISPAYTVMIPYKNSPHFFRYLFKSIRFIELLQNCVTGIREGQNIDYSKLREHLIPIPSHDEQEKIIVFCRENSNNIDNYCNKLQQQINILQEYRTRLISDVVTGKVNVQNVKVPEFEAENEVLTKTEGEENENNEFEG